jgi:hypothetical protein
MLRRIFGLKIDEGSELFSMLCNEELHDFYRSPGIVRVVKFRML